MLHHDKHPDVKLGIKCPVMNEDRHFTELYLTHFPCTSKIVGIRHPVLWFESYYIYGRIDDLMNAANAKGQAINIAELPIPKAQELTGSNCFLHLCVNAATIQSTKFGKGHPI